MPLKHTTVNCLINRDGPLDRGTLHITLIDGALVDGFGRRIKFERGDAVRGWGNNDCKVSLVWCNFILNPAKLSKSLRKLGLLSEDFLLRSI